MAEKSSLLLYCCSRDVQVSCRRVAGYCRLANQVSREPSTEQWSVRAPARSYCNHLISGALQRCSAFSAALILKIKHGFSQKVQLTWTASDQARGRKVAPRPSPASHYTQPHHGDHHPNRRPRDWDHRAGMPLDLRGPPKNVEDDQFVRAAPIILSRDRMTAGSGLASPPVRLPKLSPLEKSPSKPTKRTSAPPAPRKSSFVVVDGAENVRTAPVNATRRSSLPLPLPRTAGVLGDSRPRLRRRSGDFSLPVKYKVRSYVPLQYHDSVGHMNGGAARKGRTCTSYVHSRERQLYLVGGFPSGRVFLSLLSSLRVIIPTSSLGREEKRTLRVQDSRYGCFHLRRYAQPQPQQQQQKWLFGDRQCSHVSGGQGIESVCTAVSRYTFERTPREGSLNIVYLRRAQHW